jgi:hypothetical protein
MGMLDKLFGKKKATLYGLSEIGKHKAEELIGQHGLRLKVVNYLEDHEASSISEISSGLSSTPEQVKIMVNKLQREQWVIPIKPQNLD